MAGNTRVGVPRERPLALLRVSRDEPKLAGERSDVADIFWLTCGVAGGVLQGGGYVRALEFFGQDALARSHEGLHKLQRNLEAVLKPRGAEAGGEDFRRCSCNIYQRAVPGVLRLDGALHSERHKGVHQIAALS